LQPAPDRHQPRHETAASPFHCRSARIAPRSRGRRSFRMLHRVRHRHGPGPAAMCHVGQACGRAIVGGAPTSASPRFVDRYQFGRTAFDRGCIAESPSATQRHVARHTHNANRADGPENRGYWRLKTQTPVKPQQSWDPCADRTCRKRQVPAICGRGYSMVYTLE
jgi:hypothetical protein